MKQWSYVNSAAQILSIYKGEEPFASFLKKYFREHKKFGSKDRKHIGHLCYCYFRLGKSELPFSVEERILIALFFCSDEPNEILEKLRPEWNGSTGFSLEEKCSMLNIQPCLPAGRCSMIDVFPWKDELSEGIEHEKFTASFFIQPDLFLRLRPGKETVVQQKLKNAGIEFRSLKEDCIALPTAVKLEEIIEVNKEAVVQDFSSQRVASCLTSPSDSELHQIDLPIRRGRQMGKSVWDCCAASGGKSIMVYDLDPSIKLTVSDVRESILINLQKRFTEAGIRKYQSFIADLSLPNLKYQHKNFDLIICDAPCTGSGTWGRTPEQLYYFEENKIEKYSLLQKQIVSNVIPVIKEEGYLLYITCSVFKKENEEVVQFIKENFTLDLVEANVIKGYEIKADTMFAALFKKRKQHPGSGSA